MGIFFISLALASIVCYVFLRKQHMSIFDMKYHIIILSAIFTFIGTITTNYIVRDKNSINSELVKLNLLEPYKVSSTYLVENLPLSYSLTFIDVPDTCIDSTMNIVQCPFIINKTESGKLQLNCKNLDSKINLDNLYIIENLSDSNTYLLTYDLNYIVNESFMRSNIGLPRYKRIKCLSIESTLYNNIPDSIKVQCKLPYNVLL